MRFELNHVQVGWPGVSPLLENVNLSVNPGDMIRLDGPSGCGKSTFLRLFNRLLEPVSGTITADGRSMHQWPVLDLRRQVAFLQQEPVMLDGTVRQNLLMPWQLRIAEDTQPPTNAQLCSELERFKLTNVTLEQEAAKLSTGQRQRLALIRLLLLKPKALLADEPVSALDANSRQIVMEAINAANHDGMTVLYITHIDWHEEPGSRHRRWHFAPDARTVEDMA